MGVDQTGSRPEQLTPGEWFLRAFADRPSCPRSALDGLDFGALEKAANLGHCDANFLLGLAHDSRSPLQYDEVRAAALYEVAARQGHATAQYRLADMYEYGDGVKRDLELARQLFLKAASQGHTGAQNRLGILCSYDHAPDRAEHWYRLASHKGHAESQSLLSRIVGRKPYTEDRALEARMWHILSLHSSVNNALGRRAADIAARERDDYARIFKPLTQEQVETLNKLVGDWYSERYFQ